MSFFIRIFVLFAVIFGTTVFASVGKVSLLKGEATLQRESQKIPLQNGTALEEKDIITTKKDAQIQLIFEDKTVITLGSESEFKIEEYFNDATKPKAKFKFGEGSFKSITGQIGKTAPENFTLETKTATIGIRGTTVKGQISENGDAIGCTSGSIIVKVLGGSGFVVVPAGKITFVAPGKEPTPPKDIKSGDLGENGGQASGSEPSSATPSAASNASENSLQNNTQKAINTNVESTYSFYPNFIPALASNTLPDGAISLSGFTTSEFRLSGVRTISADDTFILNVDTTNDSINSDSIISLQNRAYDPEGSFKSLEKSADASTLTYETINSFSIKDFENQKGWIQTENTYPNAYVSWGYWEMKSNDSSKLLVTKNYWVAGLDETAAGTHLAPLIADTGFTTSYTYNGNVLGYVQEDGSSIKHDIDPTNNNTVKLDFDFGGGINSLKNTSFIKFQTTQVTPQSWEILPTGAVTSSSFTVTNTNSVKVNTILQDGTAGTSPSASVINGKFFGNTAQAVGGTFIAETQTHTAVGVFKAVK